MWCNKNAFSAIKSFLKQKKNVQFSYLSPSQIAYAFPIDFI